MNGSLRSKRFQSSYCAKGRFFLLSSQLFSTNSRGNAWYAGYMNGNRKFGFSLDETLVSDIPRWKLLLNSSSMMLSSQKLIKRNDQLSVVMLTSGRQYTTCLRLPTLGNEKKYCDTVDTSVRGLFFPFLRVSADGRFDYLIKAFYV